MSAHTPGPWEIKTANRKRSTNIKAGLASVASVSVTNVAAEANARLIAAAPELLDAAKALHRCYIPTGGHPELAQAISKIRELYR